MNTRAKLVSAALLLAAAAAASAGLDAQIANGNLVTGTLSSAAATETFRISVPAGAALTISVKGVKKKGYATPAPTFVVRDPTFQFVGADKLATTATGATAKAIPTTKSGTYRIVVSSQAAGATGDFTLSATWKSAAAVQTPGTLAGAQLSFDFSADAGAVATFDVSQAPKSAALPRLVNATGPNFAHPFAAPTSATSKRHRATGVLLTATGDYKLFVNDAGAGGAFRGKITIKQPRQVKTKVVLTDAVLGAASDHFAQTTTIGRDGGIATPGGGGTPIDGASVSFPSGAVSSPTSVVVGTGTPVPSQAAQTGGVGPTIVFGPEGLRFAKSATITIPFDPSSFEGDTSTLVVYTRDAKGKITQVPPPLTIDPLAGTVSFQSSHFSAYRAFGPKKPVHGDLNADGFADLVIPAPGDSQNRGAVQVYFGRADFLDVPPTKADATFTGLVTEDALGRGIATGDVNDDGVDDLLMCAPLANFGQGRIYVFFGKTGFQAALLGAADAVLSGGSPDQGLGAPMVVADVTGDGIADVVAAGRKGSAGGVENGVVRVFRGSKTFASASAGDNGVISLNGAARDFDHFGVSVAAGDVTGDGVADVAVGAAQDGVQGAGIVYVFKGGLTALVSQIAGVNSLNFTGIRAGDHFGDAVAIGDFNADSKGDLAVGAPFEEGPNAVDLDVGAVRVFFGGNGLSGKPAAQADRLVANWQNPADLLGTSVMAGNVTGNAATDLIYSIPGYDGTNGDEGDLVVVTGGATFPGSLEGWAVYQQSTIASTLLEPVDVDGDGRDEAIIAAPTFNNGRGLVDVHFGPRLSSARHIVFNGQPGQRLGGRD